MDSPTNRIFTIHGKSSFLWVITQPVLMFTNVTATSPKDFNGTLTVTSSMVIGD
jgi:hypothetical protein